MTTDQNNQEVPENIVELIRKCLALSSSSNEFEAELAMSKAQELLLKYNLSVDTVKDLPDADADLAELIDCYVEKVKTDTWLRLLYSDIAALNFCKVIGHPVDKRISVLGRMVNVLATIEMAQWLQGQIERLALEASRLEANPGIPFRTSFCFGCVMRVYERLRDAQNASIANSNTSRNLIVRLDTETKEFVRKNYPDLSRSAGYQIRDNSGYQVGQRYGDKVSIVRPSHTINSGTLRLNGGS